MSNKLDPAEKERRRQARKLRSAETGSDWREHKIPVDARKHGRALCVKRALKMKRELALTSCPKCGVNTAADIIMLRQTFYECRVCGELFIKDGLVDPFDSDGLSF
jgi:predicted RNA-binding Zn-ribbon protein involved in translation (DUF1610 family)